MVTRQGPRQHGRVSLCGQTAQVTDSSPEKALRGRTGGQAAFGSRKRFCWCHECYFCYLSLCWCVLRSSDTLTEKDTGHLQHCQGSLANDVQQVKATLRTVMDEIQALKARDSRDANCAQLGRQRFAWLRQQELSLPTGSDT